MVPFAEVKAGCDHVVDAGKVPITDELSDVGKLIAEASEVDANFAQENNHFALAVGTGAKVAVGPLERAIEQAIVGLQFGQMEVRQFHDIKNFREILRFIDDERGVPIDHSELALVVADRAAD